MKVNQLLAGLIDVAQQDGYYSQGRLMSPTQVQESLSENAPDDMRLRGWFLTSDAHPSFYNLLKADAKPEPFLTSTVGKIGVHYLLVTQRVEQWQQRILLPLVGDSARQFLAELQASGVGISTSTSSSNAAFISRLFPPAKEDALFNRLAGVAVPTYVRNVGALVAEAMMLSMQLLKPDAIESNATEVRNACVTTVLTDELRLQIEAETSKGKGPLH